MKRIPDLIDERINQKLEGTWCVILAQIFELDQKRGRAKVRPLMKLREEMQGKPMRLKKVYDVPVNIDRAGPYIMRRPYKIGKRGDLVVCVVHDKALDQVKKHRRQDHPVYKRSHNLTDVIVLGSIRADDDFYLPERHADDWLVEHTETAARLVCYRSGALAGTWMIQSPNRRGIRLGVDAQYRVALQPLAEDYESHTHICPACGSPTSGPSPNRVAMHTSKLVYARLNPINDFVPPGRPTVIDIDWARLWELIKGYIEYLCVNVVFAANFLNDPIGSVADALGLELDGLGDTIADLLTGAWEQDQPAGSLEQGATSDLETGDDEPRDETGSTRVDSSEGDGADDEPTEQPTVGPQSASEAIRADYSPEEQAVAGLIDAAGDPAGELVAQLTAEYFAGLEEELTQQLVTGMIQWADAFMSDLSEEDLDVLKGVIGEENIAGFTSFLKEGWETLKGWAEDGEITLDEIGADALGAAIDAGVQKIKESANEVILDSVAEIALREGLDLPLIQSTLDFLAGICEGDLEQTLSAIWSGVVDLAVIATGGQLAPIAGLLEVAGAELIAGAFANESSIAGSEQVESDRGF